jgi:LacI family transcriptional regulator
MGYVVNRAAQKLSGVRTRIIGVITELHTPFSSELVLGIGSVAHDADYEMLVYSLPDKDRQPTGRILDLMQQFADGVIVILPYEASYLESRRGGNLPVVTIDQGVESPFPSVMADNYQGACSVLRHFIEGGHSRIAFVTGNERLASARERHRGYRDVLVQARIPFDPTLEVQGDFSLQSGIEAGRRLFALPQPPTAIFAANDAMATGVLAAAQEAGLRVPEDVSVAGFDDVPMLGGIVAGIVGGATPTLTTVRQPLDQMARAAVNMLLALVAGVEAPSREIVLPTELIVRGSTRALSA